MQHYTRCERAAGDPAAAERTLLEAASRERTWAEFWMELTYIAYDQRRFAHAIGYALQAADMPPPVTQLWREHNKYTDQPCRFISWCHEHMGDTAQALSWAVRARERIGRHGRNRLRTKIHGVLAARQRDTALIAELARGAPDTVPQRHRYGS